MRHKTPQYRRDFRVRGVTLVELLVSLAIGSLLIIGAVTVYTQSSSTYRVNEVAARLQEVARYAIEVMEPDVRQAGYWGMTNRADFAVNRGTLLNGQALDDTVGDNCGPLWSVDLERYIDGREGYDLTCDASIALGPVGWTDVLIVRRASVNTAALENGRMQLQSDRLRVEIFSDGVRPADFTDPALSETHNLVVHAYYINQEAAGPNGLPRYVLRRQTLIGGAAPSIQDQEIIPGVEDLQVQFGIDSNDADDEVDQYVDPESAELAVAGNRILSVRLWLRVVSDEREVGFVNNTPFVYANQNFGVLGDERRRVLLMKTIQLRNFQPNAI